jgi:hypothetical protein
MNVGSVFPGSTPFSSFFIGWRLLFIGLLFPWSGRSSVRRAEVSIKRISFNLGTFLPIFVLLKATIQILKKTETSNILYQVHNILWKTNKNTSGPILKN